MSNFFNDLNKMVNTIQKVDKLLTEKPKVKLITKRFTQEEINFLVEHLGGLKNFELDPDDIPVCRKIYNKLK